MRSLLLWVVHFRDDCQFNILIDSKSLHVSPFPDIGNLDQDVQSRVSDGLFGCKPLVSDLRRQRGMLVSL